jgi:hypothetical protein
MEDLKKTMTYEMWFRGSSCDSMVRLWLMEKGLDIEYLDRVGVEYTDLVTWETFDKIMLARYREWMYGKAGRSGFREIDMGDYVVLALMEGGRYDFLQMFMDYPDAPRERLLENKRIKAELELPEPHSILSAEIYHELKLLKMKYLNDN